MCSKFIDRQGNNQYDSAEQGVLLCHQGHISSVALVATFVLTSLPLCMSATFMMKHLKCVYNAKEVIHQNVATALRWGY